MPVFDFECTACGKKFTELVYGSETIICPHCGSDKIKKLFSTFYTVSDSTRYETGAQDLPTMETLQRFKKTGATKKRTAAVKRRPETKKIGKIKPRPAVHHRKIK